MSNNPETLKPQCEHTAVGRRCKLDEWEVIYETYTEPELTTITVPDLSEKTDGYPGFYTAYEFNTEGKFMKMGAWE